MISLIYICLLPFDYLLLFILFLHFHHASYSSSSSLTIPLYLATHYPPPFPPPPRFSSLPSSFPLPSFIDLSTCSISLSSLCISIYLYMWYVYDIYVYLYIMIDLFYLYTLGFPSIYHSYPFPLHTSCIPSLLAMDEIRLY